MTFRWFLRSDRRERSLVHETEAFLCGHARERYLEAGVAVPLWAELNWLAHGDPTEIHHRARCESGLRRPAGSWAWATSILVRELVAADEQGDALLRLQRECLMPMELSLMSHDRPGFLPHDLVALGVPRLRAHRSRRPPRPPRTDGA